jgi:MerR family regulatory protein
MDDKKSMKQRTPDTPVYVISVAAELIGCHPRTLRIYEERGLLSPVRMVLEIQEHYHEELTWVFGDEDHGSGHSEGGPEC